MRLAFGLSICCLLAAVNATAGEIVPELRRLEQIAQGEGYMNYVGNVTAPVFEVPAGTVIKVLESTTTLKSGARGVWVAYLSTAAVASGDPSWFYFLKRNDSARDSKTQAFRTTPDGILDLAIRTTGKKNKDGTPVRGAGKKYTDDIKSASIKKAFNAEYKFWTEEWLKSRQPKPAKQ